MRLEESAARTRLAAGDHGVLSTLHPDRGVDSVPVVFAFDGVDQLGVPVDRVKPKASTRLQRQRNLERDPRASLLVQQWDAADWSRLWWARADLAWQPDASAEIVDRLVSLLVDRYPQYRGAGAAPFDRVLVFRVAGVTGWAAGPNA